MATTASETAAEEEEQDGVLQTISSSSSSPPSLLEAYSARGIEAIAVLQEREGCRYRVVEANGRFQRWVGSLERLEKLDFIECLVKTEDQPRFKIATGKVREGEVDSIDDDTLDTVVRGCDTLLLGKLTDLPSYKRFDWAISRGPTNGSIILSGRRLTLVNKHEKEAESEFMDFFHKAPIALHWLSSTGHVLWANDRELEVLGYTAEEYIGQSIMKFCPDSEEEVLEIFKELGTGNTIRDVPVRFRTKSGEIRDLLIDSNVSYNTDGSFKHTRCFIRDDSARKVKEARSATARRFLEQQAEEKEGFTRLLFHEILTPCHISLQSLQFALGGSPEARAEALDNSVASALSDAQMQIRSMVEIINDAEDAARFEQGYIMELKPVSFSLRHAVEEAFEVVARASPTTPEVTRTQAFSEGCPDMVTADKGCLVRTLKILLKNSTKVTTAGSIEVAVSHTCGESPSETRSTAAKTQQQQQQQNKSDTAVNLTFSVKDTGPGIETTRVNALFQKYWQHTFDLGLTEQQQPQGEKSAHQPTGAPYALPSSTPNEHPTSPPTVPPSPSYDNAMSESDTPSPAGSAGGVGSRGRAPWVVDGERSSSSSPVPVPAPAAGNNNVVDVLPHSSSRGVVGGSCGSHARGGGSGSAAVLCDSGPDLAGSTIGGGGGGGEGSAIGGGDGLTILGGEGCNSSSAKVSSKNFQLASSGGIGLGLNVAYNLVQGMGGTLHVESDARTGTCFSFTLALNLCSDKSLVEAGKPGADDATTVEQSWPHVLESEAAKRIVDVPPGLKPEPPPGKGKCVVGLKTSIHVLVVDDSTICQRVLCRTLANLNCTTEVAANGQQAVEKLAAHQVSVYSLVLMDLRMPIMDGLSATRVIRGDLGVKNIPIVAISAERSDELCEECLAAGMNDFLKKPASKVSIEEILHKVGALDASGGNPAP